MGCCLPRNRYGGCEDVESLTETIQNDIKNYKGEMENEKNTKNAEILLSYVNDLKNVINEIESRNIKRFDRTKDLVINFIEYFDTHKKTDNEYHRRYQYLKEFLSTQKIKK
jgi:hypothetical protein